MEAALRALARARDDAIAAIEASPDPQQAFSDATELAEALRAGAGEAAELRARAATRIWESEQMSLTVLAKRIGVSKQRAGQMIQSAKSAEEEE